MDVLLILIRRGEQILLRLSRRVVIRVCRMRRRRKKKRRHMKRKKKKSRKSLRLKGTWHKSCSRFINLLLGNKSMFLMIVSIRSFRIRIIRMCRHKDRLNSRTRMSPRYYQDMLMDSFKTIFKIMIYLIIQIIWIVLLGSCKIIQCRRSLMSWVWIIFMIIIFNLGIMLINNTIILKYHKLFKILIKCNFINKIKFYRLVTLINKIIRKKVIWVQLLLEIQYHLLKMKIL